MRGIGPQLSKFIKQKFPVVRKRSALWFFNNEIRNNLAVGSVNSNNSATSEPKKISRNKILLLWKNMDPESKRKYFNMAEFDGIRYQEQKSLWVSKIGALLAQNQGSLDNLGEFTPSYEMLQREFLGSLDELHKNYERMIQAESTKTLYKDAIRKADISESSVNSDELISTVPSQHRPILTQPRRPPPAFVLFLNDNMEKYKQIRRAKRLEASCMKLGGDEWAKLDPKIKDVYEKRYQQLIREYNRAMEEYRNSIEANNNGHLVDQASKEKRAFKKSLRKRLRDASLWPLSIRNAFNFFLMDHKDVKLTDLTEVWRNLPMERKLKYIEMSQADVSRYENEMEAYREIKKGLREV